LVSFLHDSQGLSLVDLHPGQVVGPEDVETPVGHLLQLLDLEVIDPSIPFSGTPTTIDASTCRGGILPHSLF
jgi:hypothetical protein